MTILREFDKQQVIRANEDNIAQAYTALYSGWDEALSHAGEAWELR